MATNRKLEDLPSIEFLCYEAKQPPFGKRIKTTVTRAKELRSVVEKMITLWQNQYITFKPKNFALSYITKEDVVKNYLMKLSEIC